MYHKPSHNYSAVYRHITHVTENGTSSLYTDIVRVGHGPHHKLVQLTVGLQIVRHPRADLREPPRIIV